jgi:photosystem II stability/assembly factor-like uncharacterized protein
MLFLGVSTLAVSPSWTVLSKQFSAVSVGIAFQDHKVGWTTFTDGSSPVQLVKTSDSGATWHQVNSSAPILIATGFGAAHGNTTDVAMVGALGGSQFSLDGDNFAHAKKSPFDSQSIKFQGGRMVSASADGACTSPDGSVYSCVKIPFKNAGSGRYISSPSADVIYVTAGHWPAQSANTASRRHLSRNLKLETVAGKQKLSLALNASGTLGTADDPSNYSAELWKSSDGGKTWVNLITDEGAFYFNDIDCFDENNCVAVGEGFSQDGSSSPGARVYVTSNGADFTLVHQEADGSSLMAAKMISPQEHWATGTTKVGGFLAPLLALHSKDAGQSWANEHGGVTGQMITAMDFLSPTHGYATTVNALQISSLLQYGTAPSDEKAASIEASSGQCSSASYAFCCGIGAPCDCSKGTTAPGQCKPESYVYCCQVGPKCDCSQPPIAA